MPQIATFSIKKHNDFLKGVSDFFESGTDAQSRNFCKKHHIEHIGKTAYSIGIDVYLYKLHGDEKYFKRAYRRAFRVISKLENVNGSYVYLPDGPERFNMSQRVIDAGAATDMLATFLSEVGNKLSPEEHEKVSKAIRKNVETYLVKASVEKAPTNQRLWGATGLASAYKLIQKEEWTEALRASVERSLGEIKEDGSIPYITAYEGYADASYNEITPFYHSRHAAYAWHVLDTLAGDNTKEVELLIKSTDFLIGLYQADGRKCMQLETKHWYFLSEYEISSNSYDVYSFLRAYECTGDNKYAYYAAIALEQLYAHQLKNGALDDHIGYGVNFQCQHFWNGNTFWLTRIAHLVETLESKQFTLPSMSVAYKSADLIKIVIEDVSVLVRGAKVPYGYHMGPKVGGGSLVYVGFGKDKYKNLVPCTYTNMFAAANWHWTRDQYFSSNRISYSKGKTLLYYALIELRSGGIVGFLQRLKVLGVFVFTKEHLSSQFCLTPEIDIENGTEISVINGSLCDMTGKGCLGNITRKYSIVGGKLLMEETFSGALPQQGDLFYTLPLGTVSEIEVNGASYKRKGNKLRFSGVSSDIFLKYKIV